MRILVFIVAMTAVAPWAGAETPAQIVSRCPSVPLGLAAEMSPPDTPAPVYLSWMLLTRNEGPARTLLAATEVRAALTCEQREEIDDRDLLAALFRASIDAAGYPQPETQRDVMTVMEIVAQSTDAYDATIYPYLLSLLNSREPMVRVTAAGRLILYRERPEAIRAVASLLRNQYTRAHGLNALSIIFNDPWVPLEYGKPLVGQIRRALFAMDSTIDRCQAASVLGKLGGHAAAAAGDLEVVRDGDRSMEVRQYAAMALRNIYHPDRYYEERLQLRARHPRRRAP